MLRLIGATVVCFIIGFAVASHYGLLNVKTDIQVTQQGKQEIQKLRNVVADEVRGQ